MKYELTVGEMEIAILQTFNPRLYLAVPNVSWGFEIHECDLILVRGTGYAVEIEIKRSLADLKKDFNKRHGHRDRQNRIKELYYAVPESLLAKALPLIDELAEAAGIISCYRKEGVFLSKIVVPARTDKKARKLTIQERYVLARLGTLKLWSAREKLIERQIEIHLK